MATIVNARDVKLQATTPRVAGVQMASNLIVDQSQVTGLGIAIDGTKLVMLQATAQVFQIAKTGTVSPASTTLSAIVRNLTTAPTLTVTSGTITPTPTLVGGVVTIGNAALITDTATIRLTVTEAGKTYTDDMTIVKVREGIDSLNGLLTNESHTVPADTLGNVLSYAGAGGTFKVFQGATDVTALCAFSLVAGGNPSVLTYSINAATGVYAVTGGYPVGTDLTTLTFRATLGSSVVDKIFTIAKTKAGSNGTNGTNGQRGSRTFYVALGGAGATFSDATATSTASVSGGPILNDVVTQYNNSVGFSLTKFWDGAVWNTLNAVVDGNLLVTGTVSATKIVGNSITAGQMAAGSISATQMQANSITAANGAIADLAVTTVKIGANQVTIPVCAELGSSVQITSFDPNAGSNGAGQNILSLTIDSGGQPIYILCHLSIAAFDAKTLIANMYVDGVRQKYCYFTAIVSSAYAGAEARNVMALYLPSPGTGTHTITISMCQWESAAGNLWACANGQTSVNSGCTLLALGLKR